MLTMGHSVAYYAVQDRLTGLFWTGDGWGQRADAKWVRLPPAGLPDELRDADERAMPPGRIVSITNDRMPSTYSTKPMRAER